MFGYIKIFPDQLRLSEANAYRSVYCGLCHQIADYAQFARMFLSFDMVFFTLLSAYDRRDLADLCVKRRCLRKIPCPDDVMDYWAAMSVLVIYHKLLNDANDGSALKRIYVLDLKNAYAKAKSRYPHEEAVVFTSLQTIELLEQNKEDDPAALLEVFGKMMGELVDASPKQDRSDALNGILRRIAENISKWLYAIDFYDDLEKDQKKKQYNPLLIRAEKNNLSLNAVKAGFRPVIVDYVAELQRLCAFLPYEGFQDIVRNVLHEGIIRVTSDVFNKDE